MLHAHVCGKREMNPFALIRVKNDVCPGRVARDEENRFFWKRSTESSHTINSTVVTVVTVRVALLGSSVKLLLSMTILRKR